MKLRFDFHIPPDEIRKKQCWNCMQCRSSSYESIREDSYQMDNIRYTCTINLKTVNGDDSATECDAYEATHWETIRVNDYRRL